MTNPTPELEAMARAYCWSANRDAIRDGEQLHAFVDAHWRDHVRGIGHALLKIREPSDDAAMIAIAGRNPAYPMISAITAYIDHILGEPS